MPAGAGSASAGAVGTATWESGIGWAEAALSGAAVGPLDVARESDAAELSSVARALGGLESALDQLNVLSGEAGPGSGHMPASTGDRAIRAEAPLGPGASEFGWGEVCEEADAATGKGAVLEAAEAELGSVELAFDRPNGPSEAELPAGEAAPKSAFGSSGVGEATDGGDAAIGVLDSHGETLTRSDAALRADDVATASSDGLIGADDVTLDSHGAILTWSDAALCAGEVAPASSDGLIRADDVALDSGGGQLTSSDSALGAGEVAAASGDGLIAADDVALDSDEAELGSVEVKRVSPGSLDDASDSDSVGPQLGSGAAPPGG